MKRRYFKLRDPWTGIFERVWLEKHTYASNDTLAIQMMCKDGPYEVLTVNLECSQATDSKAYVDTNNCPWAERFIKDNGIGEPTGVYGYSGFCRYPLYQFDLKKF